MKYLTLYSGGIYKIDIARVMDVPSFGGAFNSPAPLPPGLSWWSKSDVFTTLTPDTFIVGGPLVVQSQTILYNTINWVTTAFWQTAGQLTTGTDQIQFNILPREMHGGAMGEWFLGWEVLINANFNASCSVDIVFETSPWGLVAVEFVFSGGFNVEGMGKAFLIPVELQGEAQSSADLKYANIGLFPEFSIFSGSSAAIFLEFALSAEASVMALAVADYDNAVLFLNASFYATGTIFSPLRVALGRGDWRRVISLGGNAGDIGQERWRVEDKGGWSAQGHVIRGRNLCPEVGEEVADSVYQGGGFLGPSNEIPGASPVGNRARISAPSGQWFAASGIRSVKHVNWEYCEGKMKQCEVIPAGWGHLSSDVPYPQLFLQTNVTGVNCMPANRLRNGSGPAIWIAHFKGSSIPDWKLIAAIGLNSEIFSALAVMGVSPMDNAVSNWGPWVPTESSICNGAEFIQRSFDLNKVRRPKNRKAIGSSLEDCEYGLPWFDEVYDIKSWELLVFDGRTTVSALWYDEGNSALYLPVGENGENVFVG